MCWGVEGGEGRKVPKREWADGRSVNEVNEKNGKGGNPSRNK